MIVEVHVLATESLDPLPVVSRNQRDGGFGWLKVSPRSVECVPVDAGGECQAHEG